MIPSRLVVIFTGWLALVGCGAEPASTPRADGGHGGVAGSSGAAGTAGAPSDAGARFGNAGGGAGEAASGRPGTAGMPSSGGAPSAGAGAGGTAAGNASASGASGASGAEMGLGGTGGAGSGGGRGGRNGAGAGGKPAAGAGSGNAHAGESGVPSTPLTVFLAGDSTVQNYTDTASTTDQAGWGQMLGALFETGVTVDNRAVGGRTARRFIDEGYLDDILSDMHAGDYLLVQFGTNDSNKTATYELNGETIPYYLDPDTDFKTYLEQYVTRTHQKNANIALVTPPPRNSAYCTGGNGTGDWAQAMRELGSADSVPVLDLNQRSVDYLKAICPAPTPEDFFLLKSDGSVDGTHFQENGARILAGFVAAEMTRVGLPLAALEK
ncbi:MAG TPA: rhamnogalacturonan acetylesterase [Polyangiaceae bacterium]|jgi:lysophospholipase L1-like esterase|nr:rhamnogalacturonan acetylesterase [Polyangiaceae bacterium]